MIMPCANQKTLKAVNHGLRVFLLCIFFSSPVFTSELMKVVVMGDIESPGEYAVSVGGTVEQLENAHNLFDRNAFEAEYQVIRGGLNIASNSQSHKRVVLEERDVVIVSLTKASARVESSKEEGTVSAESQLQELLEERVVPNGELQSIGRGAQEQVNKFSDYELQSGDVLFIELPGEEGFNKEFLIDRAGVIRLPEIGQLNVAGLMLKQAEKIIVRRMSEIFLGLDKLTIRLKEKRLLVTVLGFVEQPGDVELPGNGNIQVAINQAGGFVDGALLSRLQLRRDGETITFDFKKYLDTGDEKVLPNLRSLDEIFVPSTPELSNIHGKPLKSLEDKEVDSISDREVIKVFGEVIKPISFGYEEGVNVLDAMLKGGGITRYANVEQIRVLSGSEPIMFNLKKYLDSGSVDELPELLPGATVYVPIRVDSISASPRRVYVMGQVQKPGSFETAEDVSFLDVISDAGGPNRYADITAVRILRRSGEVVPFDLEAFTEGRVEVVPTIKSGDAIFFPEKPANEDSSWFRTPTSESVKVLGSVIKPGRYEWSETVDFIDYIGNAGGPAERADLAHIKIITPGPDNERIVTEFNMQEFMEQGGDWSDLPVVKGGSTLVIPELPDSPIDNNANWVKLPKENSIYIMGAVIQPGRYAFNKNLGFLDILSAAEGPNKEADLSRIRVIHRNEGIPRVTKVDLLTFFETGDESLLPKVKSGDTIFIASRTRKWTEQEPEDTVRIMGAVATSGRYEFTTNMTILDLLAEAGGPNETAYIEKILIVNNSCCEESRASTFDLVDFMKDPDGESLPVLRAGDTIFVPEVSQSNWRSFNSLVTDTGGILNVLLLLTNLGWFTP